MSDDGNPYRPPSAQLSDADPLLSASPASRGRRYWTMVIDYPFVFLAMIMTGVGLAATIGVEETERWTNGFLGNAIGLLVYFGYYTFFEAVWARTPAKWLLGTRVVNESGGPPSLRQVLLRSLCRLIPFEPLSAFGDRPWHDSIPKTRVVRTVPA